MIELQPVNLGNLEHLLNGIWSGELPHNQHDFFCGTSCCLAGWDVALHYPEVKPEDRKDVRQWSPEANQEMWLAFADPWAWSRDHNHLTVVEATLLFRKHSTRLLHTAVLNAFKGGRRLEIYSSYLRTESAYSLPMSTATLKKLYENPKAVIVIEEENVLALTTFLGEEYSYRYDNVRMEVTPHEDEE